MTHAEMVEKIGQARAADFRESSRRYVAAAFAAPTIMVLEAAARAGYVLVPLEATEEMIEAAIVHMTGEMGHGKRSDFYQAYRAAIAARPGQEKEDV